MWRNLEIKVEEIPLQIFEGVPEGRGSLILKKSKIMKIPIASDHAGFELKQFIISNLTDFLWEDEGCCNLSSVDYPDFAHPVAAYISEHPAEKGVLICGSGNGMQMAANKHPNVRAALCWNSEIARLARSHNDANILVLPARFISQIEAIEIINVFFETPFEGGRHAKRVEKIDLS
jgi:ribose 5-phosphate isomerase B